MNTLNDLKDCAKFTNLRNDVLPFVLFYDEIECGNALGSHKGVNKSGAVYLSMQCFPLHYYSSSKSIYTCCLFPTKLRGYLDVVIEKLVKDISIWTEGIIILNKRVFFQFVKSIR